MFSLAINLAAAANQSGSSITDLAWRRYLNTRYSYTTCYPSRLMRPGPRVDADDGRTFRSATGATLAVWGSYAVEGVNSLASRVDDARNDIRSAGGVVTYERSRPGWTVISGRSARTIFWSKIMQRDDRIIVISLNHSAAEAKRYASVATALNACSKIKEADF